MSYNMSYCRFENTAGALRECQDALSEGIDQKELSSEHERRGYKRLLILCAEIAEDYADEIEELRKKG